VNDQHPIDRLAEEFAARRRHGENPRVGEFAERLPGSRDEIEDLLPVVDMLEQCLDDAPLDLAGGHSDLALNVFGDYYVVREVGRGGMGVVFEAKQLSLDRRVAIKVLPERLFHSPRHVVRFQREAQSAARLHHANIVPVFGVGQQQRTHYYVMQYIDGFGLDQVILELRRAQQDEELIAEFLQADESLTGTTEQLLRIDFTTRKLRLRAAEDPALDEVLAQAEWARGDEGRFWFNVAGIGIQVANALQFAHEEGVLHRDVKPSNLILDHEGVVWVTDFGLAKLLDKGDLTASSETIGTLRYMAPEQLHGHYAATSDVYGIGATLYELLTLRPVVTEESRVAQMRQLAEDQPVPPRSIDPAIPADLETIVLKAIAKNPADRYETPAALAADLRCYLYGEPISARPLGPLARAWRWCGKHPAVARLIFGYALLTLTFLVALVVGYVRMRSAMLALEDDNDGLRTTLESTRRQLDNDRDERRDDAPPFSRDP
jgi:eukaryotic-like serine/threonine-protein kinase